MPLMFLTSASLLLYGYMLSQVLFTRKGLPSVAVDPHKCALKCGLCVARDASEGARRIQGRACIHCTVIDSGAQ